jgi:hypothetical protein
MSPAEYEAIRGILKHLSPQRPRLAFEVLGREEILIERHPQPGERFQEPTSYVEVTSLYGIVDLVSIREPRPYLVLRENNTQAPVRVQYDARLLPKVREALGRLVEITGALRSRADGWPLTMRDIADIEIYPDEIPDILSLRGAIPGLLDHMTLDEYMDDIRGRIDE